MSKNFLKPDRRLRDDGSGEVLAIPLWPDAGRALGLGKTRTYESARAGEIPTIRFGKSIRVPIAALRKMLEGAPESEAVR